MLKRWLHGSIAKFERAYGYEAGYLHEVIDASPAAAIRFALFQPMARYSRDVPKEARFAASLAAALSEDCGPCTQLVVDMALKFGVAPHVLSALLRGDIEQAGKDAELGFRYGIAVAQNTSDAPMLAEEAEARWGKRGLISLAFAVAGGRVYPALKRGLGHGAACAKIAVAEETITLMQAA